MPKGLLIAAPRSGSGKTTITLGLLRALARRGMSVSAFKCGPDYIDTAFHAAASGHVSYNLDSWAMPQSMLERNVSRGCEGAEFIIAEGSMGLFDGVATEGASGDGASATIAKRFGLPVILMLDASGQSQSAGAVALGFRNFAPDITIAGVILGNIASDRHAMLARRGVERAGLQVLGVLPRGSVPPLPERHLGLVQAGETLGLEARMEALADAMEKHLDIETILAAANPIKFTKSNTISPAPAKCIALASDIAFSFMYAHMLADWRDAGVRILPFSPLADEAPSPEADLCWLPGGYPELHAQQLSCNENFMEGLRKFATTGRIHGECGGYMVLGDTLIDANGEAWPMAGLLPLTTSFATRKLHLGYRAVRLTADTPFAPKGSLLRGHEFHYASITGQGTSESLGTATDANGTSLGAVGQKVGNVTGTFFHTVSSDA